MPDVLQVVDHREVVRLVEEGTLVVTVVEGGPRGPRGPGILSNIARITASVDPPEDPVLNDLWVDIS